MDEFGEFFGGVIFVDNGVDTFDAFQYFSAINWNTATTSGDNDNAVLDEVEDGLFFYDIDWFGAGDHTAPTAAGVLFDGPVVFGGEGFSFFFGIKLSNGFSWIVKRRVFAVDNDLGNDSSDFFAFALFCKSVIDGLG